MMATMTTALALIIGRVIGAYARAWTEPARAMRTVDEYDNAASINTMREARKRETNLSWREGSSRDAARGDARRCYGASSNDATFAIYTSLSNVHVGIIDDLMRHTLKYVRAHDGVRFCVRLISHDASRSSTWNSASAAMEHALCAGSRTKWALFISGEVVIDDFSASPDELLRRVERAVGEDVFASRVLFFTGDEVGAAKMGAVLMRIDDRAIAFFRRVWNDYHGITFFGSQPRRAFERALETFRRESTVDFTRDAVVLPYGTLARRWNDGARVVNGQSSIMGDTTARGVHDLDSVTRDNDDEDDGKNAGVGQRSFLVDYAGYSRRIRGRDVYERIAHVMRPSLVNAPVLEDPVDIYPGRVRFAKITATQAQLLRVFPTKIIVNSCGALSSELGNVLFFQ